MHEMSITQGIVDLCLEKGGGRRVLSVIVEIGELSGVVPDAVEFCFEACCRGTAAEGACLEIRRIPGRGSCTACGAEFPRAEIFAPCPSCGSYAVATVAGEELRVVELEVE